MRNTTRFSLLSAAALLVTVGIFASQTLFSGCDPAVSDEATVTVEGRLLYQDGTPASDVFVRLNKTDLDILDVDWVVGNIVNQDKTPFKSARTDSEGHFLFEFSGAEANNNNQMWAAYFVVYAIHPDDPASHLAVASDSFSFNNQSLNKVVPDMRFWDIPTGGLTISDTDVTVSFEATDLAPENGTYLVYFADTAWTAEVKGTSFSLPLYALEPCTESVKDDPSECVPKTTHAVQIISLADGLRYRSAWHTFEATNPEGLGLWFRDPDDNRSASTCSGKVLYDLNDGKFSGENAIAVTGGGVTQQDLQCIIVDLQEPAVLSRLLLHNGTMLNHKDAVLDISTTNDEDPDTATWQLQSTWEGTDQRFWNVNLDVDLKDTPARFVRLQLADKGGEQSWFYLGEISLFGVPQTAD